jgi:RNA polymerase sigma-70 factor (ECF subfamily)
MTASLCLDPATPCVNDLNHVFRGLVRQHGQRLHRYVARFIGDCSDAEDLAQQAFVEAATTYGRFRGDSQPSTWLYGIAMNLVRNHLSRAPSRRFQFEGEEALDDHVSEQPDPSRQLELTQTMHLLQRELDELTPEQREVLLLVALDELSYEQAADLLAIPVGTVRSRVSRARSQLRHRFAGAGVGASLS